ncbi:CheA signal transduction histidine kinase [Anaeromyxobacter sp. K]|uniref:hybrid sensor histidine kinase/response regulator n=1 Tax=Anaeromyxobacter sp. (strain K) TaxID=447217 RepID=UPI00015F9AC3|nr:response regulator [Anaeromyxobacter sp. K]ACG73903.1 CheA signal transduction histidine kinase [Anaeromyxobacter sp. K]
MDADRLQALLRATFLGELEDHVRSLTADLLALERAPGPDRAELLQRIFRTVHSVKGSSRAASVEAVEAQAARMERTLAAARDRPPEEARPLVDELLDAVDAIEEAGRRLRGPGEREGSPLSAVVRPAEPSGAGAGSVRLDAARLDRLQALEAELRAARHAGEGARAPLEALQAEVRRWRAEWADDERVLRDALGRAAAPAAAQAAAGRQAARLARLESELERLSAAGASARRRVAQAVEPLAEELRALRMVPFAEACAGLERAARDVARGAGKEVDVSIAGGEVSLDRAVADALRAPLLHLVRNAVDHGLESPSARAAAGKPARGRIGVTAVLRGGEVEIAVEDDGAGLDLDAIRRRAERGGLPEAADARALARRVFLPGFTTAPQVTEVSGQGVGLDAVRAAVEALQGAVDVETRPGHGTRFVLVVPLTLLALRALVVSCGGESVAIPASQLRRLLQVHPDGLRPLGGRDTVTVDGEPVPAVALAEVLGLPAAAPAGGRAPLQLAVVAAGGRAVALAVDALVAEQELRVRGLGARVRALPHLAGAALLPDGGVALVLNVPAVVASAMGRPTASLAPAAAAPRRRPRVLLVDDSPTTRALERSILETAGYRVATAADGAEAWAILEREGADALVADVEMPRLDGFALTEAVRASRALAALPVVLVTAREAEADRARGLAAGASAYLVKSAFDQRSLLDTLERLLG